MSLFLTFASLVVPQLVFLHSILPLQTYHLIVAARIVIIKRYYLKQNTYIR